MDTTLDFPFVADLPKREKSVIRTLWDEIGYCCEAQKRFGPVLPETVAAGALGISRQRMNQLVKAGRFETVTMGKRTYVTEDSLRAFAATERKSGRPAKVDEPFMAINTVVKKVRSIAG